MSVAALTVRGVLVQFKRDQAVLMSDYLTVAVIKRVGKLSAWIVRQLVTFKAHRAGIGVAINNTNALWHACLGHVSAKKIMQAMKSCDGILGVIAPTYDVCDGCARCKLANIPFRHASGSNVKTTRPLEILFIGLTGPINPKSNGRDRYLLTFIKDYSRLCMYTC